MADKLTTVLWFDGDAEEAARFYADTFPDSALGTIFRAPSDFPGGKQGDALTVEFTVCGLAFSGLNGGDMFKPNESVSFMVVTEDQAETDRYWDAITGNGGEEARRAFEAMMTMHKIDVAAIDAARKGD